MTHRHVRTRTHTHISKFSLAYVHRRHTHAPHDRPHSRPYAHRVRHTHILTTDALTLLRICSFINNTFRDGASRVGPLNSPHSTFAFNTATGTMLGGLLVSAELTWLSGNIDIDDVNVTGNTFADCCSYTRIRYPYGQCSQPASGSSTMVPLYNPAQSTDVVWENNSYS